MAGNSRQPERPDLGRHGLSPPRWALVCLTCCGEREMEQGNSKSLNFSLIPKFIPNPKYQILSIRHPSTLKTTINKVLRRFRRWF